VAPGVTDVNVSGFVLATGVKNCAAYVIVKPVGILEVPSACLGGHARAPLAAGVAVVGVHVVVKVTVPALYPVERFGK
jgi:hypothetical protein